MRIFLTGATGFIGSAVIPELIQAGHQVIGLTRSEAGAEQLRALGVEAHRGELEDPQSLRSGAAKADAVIHLAFDHNFANFVANTEKDRRAIEAMGRELEGSDRLLVITSGIGLGIAKPGQPATEDHFDPDHPNPRRASELAGIAAAERGTKVCVVRLPQVHDTLKQGLITPLIDVFRQKGVVAYVGDGSNRWAAGHISDVARLYKLAVEKQEAGVRYHAVGEEGIAARDIAEVLGRGLQLPVKSVTAEEAPEYFGWMSMFAGYDMPASSAQTQRSLGWHPTGPGLITDLQQMRYF
jgi:nucleoside-diphosphate-sugar epimerase